MKKVTINIKFVFSTIIGSVLEFYDFMLYGIFAGVIAAAFFPEQDSQTRLMLSLAVLAVGYFTRPLGGLLFGHFGDKYSRRQALTIALILMGVITTLMGLVPDYHVWGITATIMLVVLRMLQGLTVGGEMSGAIVFLLEAAKPQYRALTSIMSLVGAMSGVLLAVLVADIVTTHFTADAIQHYAWRLPFLIGLLLAIVGSYLRLKLWQDKIIQPVKLPLAVLFREHWRAVIQAILFLSMPALYTAIVSIYFVPYVTQYFHYPLQTATQMELYLTLSTIVGLVIGAWLVDKWQCYHRWLLVGTLMLTVSSYPLFLLMQHTPQLLLPLFLVFSIAACLVMGAEILFFAGLFPSVVRYSGVGFTHGMALSLIGGTSPLILNYTIIHFGPATPGFLFSITTLLAFIAVLVGKQNYL